MMSVQIVTNTSPVSSYEDDAVFVACQMVKNDDGVLGRAAHIVPVEVDI
jgi:hypothetical protein